jgi:hypothetical protein
VVGMGQVVDPHAEDRVAVDITGDDERHLLGVR